MSISDPGDNFPYLVVNSNGKELFVRKTCRAIRYDPFWESESAPQDFKPDMTLLTSNIPSELWDIMSEEERLMCHLAEARIEVRKLRKRNASLLGALVLVAGIGWTFVVLFFSR
jgi:hypothetical protein